MLHPTREYLVFSSVNMEHSGRYAGSETSLNKWEIIEMTEYILLSSKSTLLEQVSWNMQPIK